MRKQHLPPRHQGTKLKISDEKINVLDRNGFFLVSWCLGGEKVLRNALVFLLVFSLALSPRLASVGWAQDKPEEQDSASQEEIQAVQQLAKRGYLSDKKDFYLSAKSLAEDDITDALVQINDLLSQVDLKGLKPGSGTYKADDLKVLLKLVKDKSEDIRARKLSAWKLEKRIEKMIAAVAPSGQAPAGEAVQTSVKDSPSKPTPEAEAPTATPEPPKPTPTATPIPGPSRAEWDQMKGDLRDLTKKTEEIQSAFDKKLVLLQKADEENKGASKEIKTSNAENQEQLKLVKRLLERVQEDLKKTDDRLDQVAQKA
jgi:hypothetical protein